MHHNNTNVHAITIRPEKQQQQQQQKKTKNKKKTVKLIITMRSNKRKAPTLHKKYHGKEPTSQHMD